MKLVKNTASLVPSLFSLFLEKMKSKLLISLVFFRMREEPTINGLWFQNEIALEGMCKNPHVNVIVEELGGSRLSLKKIREIPDEVTDRDNSHNFPFFCHHQMTNPIGFHHGLSLTDWPITFDHDHV